MGKQLQCLVSVFSLCMYACSREMDLKTEDAYEEEQRPRRSVGRPRSVSNIKKVGGKKRKFLR